MWLPLEQMGERVFTRNGRGELPVRTGNLDAPLAAPLICTPASSQQNPVTVDRNEAQKYTNRKTYKQTLCIKENSCMSLQIEQYVCLLLQVWGRL